MEHHGLALKWSVQAHGFARDNKDVICEGLSASAVYDQLLKPSGTCWPPDGKVFFPGVAKALKKATSNDPLRGGRG